MDKLKIRIDEDRLLTTLAELVALDTCFPPGDNYPEMADVLTRLTASFGGTNQRIDVPEDRWNAPGVSGARTNLIVRPDLAVPGAPEVTVYFHVDTAPIGEGWSRPPLSLMREGNKFYGRGAADMKGAIAAALMGLTALKSFRHYVERIESDKRSEQKNKLGAHT